MQDLWRRLETYLRKHAPAALDCLNPPATETEIRDAEERLGVRFPRDLIASLRVHNGQAQETGKPPHPLPFIPQEFEQGGIYRATYGELAPLEQIFRCTIAWRENIREFGPEWANDFEKDGPVRRDGNWSWLIFVDAGSGDMLGLDLNPPEDGHIGQVISIIHDPSCLLVLAPSFRQWFGALVTRFESGRYFFEERDGELEAVDHLRSKPGDGANPDSPTDGSILRFPR